MVTSSDVPLVLVPCDDLCTKVPECVVTWSIIYIYIYIYIYIKVF
jgi:hypothetical protein